MSDQEYVAGYTQIAHEFDDYGLKLQNERIPVDQSMTPDQRRAAVAKSVMQTGDYFMALANEEAALKPPAKYGAVHKETLGLYYLEADQWHQWGQAMARNDRVAEQRIGAEMDTAPYAQFEKIRAEVLKVAPNDPRINHAFAEFDQTRSIMSGNTPPSATPQRVDKGIYVAHWTKICYEYCAVSRTLRRGPDPIKGETRQQFDARLLSELDICADNLDLLAKREAAVLPPHEYEAMHEATIKLLSVQAPLWRQFREAYKTKDRASGHKALAELSAAIPKLLAELRKASEETPSRAAHDEEIATMEKWNPLAPPTNPNH